MADCSIKDDCSIRSVTYTRVQNTRAEAPDRLHQSCIP